MDKDKLERVTGETPPKLDQAQSIARAVRDARMGTGPTREGAAP